ncbi:hypothetical protein SAMN05443144_10672 [Fodinibius roseus]|uniref:Uncharacterized protein n=1 Tax=Fodinibius roseus TaxID=1194090 RepID=A0A1M4ZM05_9BACT|nr:hypothetical protein SAMN05443144_10672 [Fodinibius roseus]
MISFDFSYNILLSYFINPYYLFIKLFITIIP